MGYKLVAIPTLLVEEVRLEQTVRHVEWGERLLLALEDSHRAGLEPHTIGGTEAQLVTFGSGSGFLDCRQLGSLDILSSKMSCQCSAPCQLSLPASCGSSVFSP